MEAAAPMGVKSGRRGIKREIRIRLMDREKEAMNEEVNE